MGDQSQANPAQPRGIGGLGGGRGPGPGQGGGSGPPPPAMAPGYNPPAMQRNQATALRAMPQQQGPRQWAGLGAGANSNLAGGRSVYGHQIGEDTWTNPQFNPDQNVGGYTRFDETQRGSGLERAKTFDDGASIYDKYKQQNHAASAGADKWMAGQGIDPATANAEQKFDAMDNYFRGQQKKNERPKRSFGVDDLLGHAISFGSSFIPIPGASVIGSAVGSKIRGNSWSDALRSGGTSFATGQFNN